MRKIYIFYSTLLLSLLFTSVRAQESVNAAGGNASGSGGTVSYSVGQLTCKGHSGANMTMLEGLQQPYEISVVIGIDEAKNITLSVTVYPNPTSDYLTLHMDTFDLVDVSYQLYNIHGKLLQNDMIANHETTIAMPGFVAGTYFVKVIQGSKEVKTFKIIKK